MNAKFKNLNLEQVVEGIRRTVRELKGEARNLASYAAKVKGSGQKQARNTSGKGNPARSDNQPTRR